MRHSNLSVGIVIKAAAFSFGMAPTPPILRHSFSCRSFSMCLELWGSEAKP
jgi:hypothetical protein